MVPETPTIGGWTVGPLDVSARREGIGESASELVVDDGPGLAAGRLVDHLAEDRAHQCRIAGEVGSRERLPLTA
jgi:hypothetical protein